MYVCVRSVCGRVCASGCVLKGVCEWVCVVGCVRVGVCCRVCVRVLEGRDAKLLSTVVRLNDNHNYWKR